MHSRVVGWRLLLVGAVLSGCSDAAAPGPPCADPDGGVFVGEVSGAESGSIRGCAAYAVTGGGSSNTVLVITVGPAAAPLYQVSLVRSGTRPPMGTYPIGVNAGNFTGAVLVNPGGRTFGLTSGSVTIDASTDGDLQGSFTVTGAQAGSGTTITIGGTFGSVCTPAGALTC